MSHLKNENGVYYSVIKARKYHAKIYEEFKLAENKDRDKRPCLRCDKLFDSMSPHNRLCVRCKKRGEDEL